MRIGIAVDHGGFELKEPILDALHALGHEAVDFGAYGLAPDDDYPDFVVPLAQAVGDGKVERGIAVCGSGVGACIAANKVPRVRAALITDVYSAHQGAEHDDMNVICLGARVIGCELAQDLIRAFLAARFTGAERHQRRLAKVAALEHNEVSPGNRSSEQKPIRSERKTTSYSLEPSNWKDDTAAADSRAPVRPRKRLASRKPREPDTPQ